VEAATATFEDVELSEEAGRGFGRGMDDSATGAEAAVVVIVEAAGDAADTARCFKNSSTLAAADLVIGAAVASGEATRVADIDADRAGAAVATALSGGAPDAVGMRCSEEGASVEAIFETGVIFAAGFDAAADG
jgi:hypothetical protein